MIAAHGPLSLSPHLPLKYVGGDASLDLVNTADWTDAGIVNDRVVDYERLTHWAEGAGVLDRATGHRLRRRARAYPTAACEALEYARDVRWILKNLFSGVVRGRHAGHALDEFNRALRSAMRRLYLVPTPHRAYAWRWDGEEDALRAPLWPVLWSAARLLAAPESEKLRLCAGEDCGWLYVDRSRNGLRRWCEMATCGTREKTRRRAQRRSGG